MYAGLLAEEFGEHACRLIALNARLDDSPEGELHGGMLDLIAAWERKKTAERTRRRKLQKARQGKIVATHSVDYGFMYNATRDGYEVDEETMPTVRRIFRMVGLDGCSFHKIKQKFEAEGLPTPAGKKYWSKTFIREVIKDDAYRPHGFEEIEALVTPEVAARLDPEKSYGVWWFNRQRHTFEQVVENTSEGKVYRKKKKAVNKPREEWIAVPVPDAGIPRELVDAARAAIKDNRRPSSAGRRFWELSGGILRCGECDYAMTTNTIPSCGKRLHFYYRCAKRVAEGKGACGQRKNYRADKVEGQVWEAVSDHMKDPEQLRADLERMIELKKREISHGNPDREARTWAQKVAECARLRGAYQDQQAAGLMTLEELASKLKGLEEIRDTAKRELQALQSRQESMEELEKDKEALLERYKAISPEALDALTPEKRHRFYKMVRLEIVANPDGSLEATWAGDGFSISNLGTGRRSPSSTGLT